MQERYSIGEVATMLQVSTRTIRFYDEKNLVKPAHIKENGYRFYEEKQIKQLKLVIYLKELGFSLKQIKMLICNKHSGQSINLLLEQQYLENKQKIAELNKRQKQIEDLKKIIFSRTTLTNISDITNIMKKENELKALRNKIVVYGMILTLFEIAGIGLSIYLSQMSVTTILIMEIIALIVIVFVAVLGLSRYYYNKVEYVCPNCGNTFVPSFIVFNLSPHTPRFRKLICPRCDKKSYCLEISRS